MTLLVNSGVFAGRDVSKLELERLAMCFSALSTASP